MSKLRAKLEREDHAVRNATQDSVTPTNAFETHVGHFWNLLNTHEYMHARFAVAKEARLVCTLDGATEALEHFQDMMRLCSGDGMGLRDYVAPLLLRLGRDQECYDFIKWWETTDHDDYDWGDTELSLLGVKNADVTEEPDFLLHRCGSLGFLASVILLKLKMLIDIRNIKVVRKVVTGRLPIELWREIERSAVTRPLSHRYLGRPYGDLVKAEGKLVLQCRAMGIAIIQTNKFFTSELLSPSRATFNAAPGPYSEGSREEMVLTMREVYPAWCETPDALDFLHQAHACAISGLRLEVAGLEQICGQDAAAKRKIQLLVMGKTWDVFGQTAQDSAYLGPPHEKPSVKHAKDHREQYQLPPVQIWSGGGNLAGLAGLSGMRVMGDFGGLENEDDIEEGNSFECHCFDHDFYHQGRDPWGEAYEAGIL